MARRKFSPEFKADAVKLVQGGRSVSSVAEDLGVSHSTLGRWAQQAETDAGRGPEGALTSTEKQELSELRREVKKLREEREILKKATAFFAKENG